MYTAIKYMRLPNLVTKKRKKKKKEIKQWYTVNKNKIEGNKMRYQFWIEKK